MKKVVASLACAAAMLPGVSAASQFTDSDTLDFVASSTSYTAKFSWADLFSDKTTTAGYASFEADGKYSITLTDATHMVVASFNNIADGITGDVNGVLSGSFLQTFSSLVAGSSYTLSFTGKWSNSGFASYTTQAIPTVSVTAVPEPETYAMLLAGLGLVGTMVRRRSNRA